MILSGADGWIKSNGHFCGIKSIRKDRVASLLFWLRKRKRGRVLRAGEGFDRVCCGHLALMSQCYSKLWARKWLDMSLIERTTKRIRRRRQVIHASTAPYKLRVVLQYGTRPIIAPNERRCDLKYSGVHLEIVTPCFSWWSNNPTLVPHRMSWVS